MIIISLHTFVCTRSDVGVLSDRWCQQRFLDIRSEAVLI